MPTKKAVKKSKKKSVKKKTKKPKQSLGIFGKPFTPIRAIINNKVKIIETYEELQKIVGDVDE